MEGANFAEIIKWIKEFDDKDPLLKEIQNIWQESQDDLNKAVETVSEAVKNLKEKGFIVIPGGWKSDPFGHAMLYMFQKAEIDALREPYLIRKQKKTTRSLVET